MQEVKEIYGDRRVLSNREFYDLYHEYLCDPLTSSTVARAQYEAWVIAWEHDIAPESELACKALESLANEYSQILVDALSIHLEACSAEVEAKKELELKTAEWKCACASVLATSSLIVSVMTGEIKPLEK